MIHAAAAKRHPVEPSDDAPHLLLVDDDRRIRDLLSRFLANEGYRVTTAASAKDARAKLLGLNFDMLILDVMMPGETGFDLARFIRTTSVVPIIMLTARDEAESRIEGLQIGADDYVAKPFEPRELLARLRAVLRRPAMVAPEASPVLRFGRLDIDGGARVVRIDGQERALTAYQFDLLLAMAERAGRVLSREQLIDAVKGETLEPFDRSIDVHIGRLRAAIEDDVKQPKRIITVRGAGYVFAKVQDA